jgi:hypothetical protein
MGKPKSLMQSGHGREDSQPYNIGICFTYLDIVPNKRGKRARVTKAPDVY